MGLLTAVIKKEFLQHVRGFRFIAVAGMMVVLAALAGFVGTDDYRQRASTHAEQVALSEKELSTITVYSYLQPIVAREPEPLSVFDHGFEGRLQSSLRINLYEIPAPAVATGSTLLAWSRDLDLASDLDLTMIVRLVLGLLAFLLTFDAIVGEKRLGTLKLALAQDLRRSTLVVGKFLGAVLALTLPLVSGFGLTLWMLLQRGGVSLEMLHWPRLAGLLGIYVAYLSSMVLIGLMLSLVARGNAAALVLSLLTWLTLMFLVPQAMSYLSSAFQGAHSPAFETRIRRLEEERDRKLADIEAELTARMGESRIHLSPVREPGFTGMVGARRWRYGTATFYDGLVENVQKKIAVATEYADRIYAERHAHRERMRAAEERARAISRPSPAYLLERLAEALAGTAPEDLDRFLQTAREYRRTLLDYLESRGATTSWKWFTDDIPPRPWFGMVGLTAEQAAKMDRAELMERWVSEGIRRARQALEAEDDDDPARRLDLQDLPRFEQTAESLLPSLERAMPEILALLLLHLVLATAVAVGFERYDVVRGGAALRRGLRRRALRSDRQIAPDAAASVDPIIR